MAAPLSKQSLSILIFFTFLFLWGAAPVDALWCTSTSKILRAECVFNHVCQRACVAELFSYGRCQTELMSRLCKCFKECDGGGGGPQDLVLTTTTEFMPPVQAPNPTIEKIRTELIIGTVVTFWVLLLLVLGVVSIVIVRRTRKQTDDIELLRIQRGKKIISLQESW